MLHRWIPILLLACLPVSVSFAQERCVGDCDGDSQVRVSELVRGVKNALGQRAVQDCPAIDDNGDRTASISELIEAVKSALKTCAAEITVTIVGDSITFGTDGPAVGGIPSIDPDGGFVGRLARRLGSRAHVVGRGLPGSSTRTWLAPDWIESDFVSAFVADVWPEVQLAPARTEPLLVTVLDHDRPGLVLILLGINDLPDGVVTPPSSPASILDRLERVEAEAARRAPRVLVSTLLPNYRDDPGKVSAVNDGIRSRFVNRLALGELFLAAGGLDALGDSIHPSGEGHEILAVIIERELERLGFVAPR